MGLILGAVLLTFGVVLFLLIPVLRGEWVSLKRSAGEPTEVEARKHVALKGLRDAEYDYRSGKLDERDYRTLRAEMSREALAAMEEEGELVASGAASPSVGGRRRTEGADLLPGREASDKDVVEREIAGARRGLAEGRICSECGYSRVEGSRFCAGCGRPLTALERRAPSAG